jgi:hypothetical protein
MGALLLAFGVAAGCLHLNKPPPYQEPTFSQYHDPAFPWAGVNRLLLLPLDNETRYPHVAEEMRNALATELQQLGRFEVVLAPPDIQARLSHQIREHGQFNEAVMIELARCFRADVIVLGAVTQCSPYRLPRLGLTLQAVSPGDCAVAASVDGVWDTTQQSVADRARAFYASGKRHSLRAQNKDQPFADELALESPRLFQRFVANEAADVLVNGLPPQPLPDPHAPAGPPPVPPPGQAVGAAQAAQQGKAKAPVCPPPAKSAVSPPSATTCPVPTAEVKQDKGDGPGK